MDEHILTDDQCQKIEKYLPKRKAGRSYKNLRAVVNAIYWLTKTGSTCRTLPERFGKLKAVHQCLSRKVMNFLIVLFDCTVQGYAIDEKLCREREVQ